jgi:hypothetical protein
MTRKVLTLLLMPFVFVSMTFAATLTAQAKSNFTSTEVENFIVAMEAVDDGYAQVPKLTRYLDSMEMTLDFIINPEGKIIIFSKIADAARNLGEGFALEEMVQGAGFYTLDHWTRSGDAIMTAYMIDEIGKEQIEMLAGMESRIDQMPEESREETLLAIRLAQNLILVPDSDVQTLAPYRQQLADLLN